MKNQLGFNRLSTTPTEAPSPVTPPASVALKTAPGDTDSTATTTPAPPHARRRRSALVISAIAVAAVLMYANRTPAPVATANSASATVSASASLTPTVPTSQSEVLSLMAQAQSYYKVHMSYTGFAPALPPGAKVSPAGQGIVISDDLSGTCAYSGMLATTVNPVYIDPTGIACTQATAGTPSTTLPK